MPTDQVNKENLIMQYFAYAHLPAPLKNVSMVIAHTAQLLNEQLPDGPEKSTALRKMLEAKDCFVRSAKVAPCITLKNAQDMIIMGWIPSAGDLFANDWMIAQ